MYVFGTNSERVSRVLWGIAAGVMAVAAIQGLLLPGLRYASDRGVWIGVITGVGLLLVARRALGDRHFHVKDAQGADARRAVLIFGVLFIHSLPEGMALGAAWATGSSSLGVFVFLAIALQNIPEGTAAAIPLREAGYDLRHSVAAAVLTSAPQPVGAVAAFALITTIHSLLGPSFGFAAGAMLALVVVEIAPIAFAARHRVAGVAAALGAAAVTVALGVILSVE